MSSSKTSKFFWNVSFVPTYHCFKRQKWDMLIRQWSRKLSGKVPGTKRLSSTYLRVRRLTRLEETCVWQQRLLWQNQTRGTLRRKCKTLYRNTRCVFLKAISVHRSIKMRTQGNLWCCLLCRHSMVQRTYTRQFFRELTRPRSLIVTLLWARVWNTWFMLYTCCTFGSVKVYILLKAAAICLYSGKRVLWLAVKFWNPGFRCCWVCPLPSKLIMRISSMINLFLLLVKCCSIKTKWGKMRLLYADRLLNWTKSILNIRKSCTLDFRSDFRTSVLNGDTLSKRHMNILNDCWSLKDSQNVVTRSPRAEIVTTNVVCQKFFALPFRVGQDH